MNTRTIAVRPLVAPPSSLIAVRMATALLITFAAALVLVHAQVYSGDASTFETPTFDPASITTAYLR